MAAPTRHATGLSVNIGGPFHVEIGKEVDNLSRQLGMGRTDLLREALYEHLADLLDGPSEYEIRLEAAWKVPAPLKIVDGRALLHTMIHEEVSKDVDSVSEELGMSRPAVLREAVHKFLRKHRGGPSPYEGSIRKNRPLPCNAPGGKGRPSKGIQDLPRIGTKVHPDVANQIFTEAFERGITSTDLLREILYRYVLEKHGLDVGAPPMANTEQK